MKHLLTALLMLVGVQVWACDGCNVSTGLVNSDPVDYVSFKFRSVEFSGEEIPFFRHAGHGGDFSEKFLNYDLIGKWFFYKNWFAQGVLTYRNTVLSGENLNATINGFSDPLLLFGYQNFEVFENWQLNYNFFAGADLGIGEYDKSVDVEYSPGSKSFDYLLGTELLARLNKVGVLAKSNIKLNTTNTQDYFFGHIMNSALGIYYYHEKEKMLMTPFVSGAYEYDMSDSFGGESLINSTSEILFLEGGVNFFFNEKLLLGGKYQYGVVKYVPGWESLDVSGFELELSYIFGD